MRAENRGPYWRILQIKVRLQNVHNMAYIALQKVRKINQNEVVCTQNTRSRDFSIGGEFRYVAKLHYIAKISLLLRKFRYYCEISLSPPACILHIPAYFQFVSSSISSFPA